MRPGVMPQTRADESARCYRDRTSVILARPVEVHRPALWILIVASSVVGVVCAVTTQLRREYYASHRTWREAPIALLKTCADAALTGLGLGLAGATVILLVAAVVARITPFH